MFEGGAFPLRPEGRGFHAAMPVKVRSVDTMDAEILDTAGPAALRVRLEDGREVTTEPLGPDAVHQVAEALADAPGPVRIEVRAGHGRHGVTRFVRVRAPE